MYSNSIYIGLKVVPNYIGTLGPKYIYLATWTLRVKALASVSTSGCLYLLGFRVSGLPVTEKTYLLKELYIETIIRNPKKVGLAGTRVV